MTRSRVARLWLLTVVLAVLPGAVAAAAEPQRIQLEESRYWCEVVAGAGRVGVERRTGAFRAIRSRPVLRRLRRRIRKQNRRIDRLATRRLGNPDIERRIVILHMRRDGDERLLAQIERCEQNPAQLDDRTDPGQPASKVPWEVVRETGFQPAVDRPTESAAEAFAFDQANYLLTVTPLHGTTVVVAVHRQTAAAADPGFDAGRFATAITRFFHDIWHVHGGYAGAQYVVKVRAPGESEGFALSQGGVVLSADDYTTLDLEAHEMVHAWNGKTYTYVPDGSGNLFQLETWLQEGATEYVATRAEARVLSPFLFGDELGTFWQWYLERLGGPFDRPYGELAAMASAFGTEASEASMMMVGRGVSFVYLLDRELTRAGSGLDALLQRLLLDFGLAGVRYTQADLRALASELGGPAVGDLLVQYIESAAPLTEVLDGTFAPPLAPALPGAFRLLQSPIPGRER